MGDIFEKREWEIWGKKVGLRIIYNKDQEMSGISRWESRWEWQYLTEKHVNWTFGPDAHRYSLLSSVCTRRPIENEGTFFLLILSRTRYALGPGLVSVDNALQRYHPRSFIIFCIYIFQDSVMIFGC